MTAVAAVTSSTIYMMKKKSCSTGEELNEAYNWCVPSSAVCRYWVVWQHKRFEITFRWHSICAHFAGLRFFLLHFRMHYIYYYLRWRRSASQHQILTKCHEWVELLLQLAPHRRDTNIREPTAEHRSPLSYPHQSCFCFCVARQLGNILETRWHGVRYLLRHSVKESRT